MSTSRLPPLVTRPRHWLGGVAYYVRREPLRWIPELIAQHGDLYRIKAALGQAVVVGNPEWARQVLADRYSHYQEKSFAYRILRILFGNGLVTSAGEFWRGQRKLIQPAFHRHRLDLLFGMMVDRVLVCADRLSALADSGEAVDMGPAMSALTLDIIARAMFSTDVEGAAARVGEHIGILNEGAIRTLRHPWLFLMPRRWPFNHRQARALQDMDRVVLGIIQKRRQQPDQHNDLLAMLLSAQSEDTGKGMTDGQLRDEVMTIFVAGHETTANAMCWLLYLVSQHPEVEARLLAEIDGQPDPEVFDPASAARFPYVRQVIDESLRMYPSIWSVGRNCTETDELAGYTIPAGTNVIIPIFFYHWSERFWENPRRFNPDRFAGGSKAATEKSIYMPFGAGPRSCIGNHFALQELVIMTVLVYRRFVFRLEPDFSVEPDPLITLRPKNGMRMKVLARRVPGQ
ncbi:MAG TPA: cytochrome P450 [Candidatus Limnocylindria bacterium]|nr:cytochrome P450 [Candidatus Limnocylindria bacterium]